MKTLMFLALIAFAVVVFLKLKKSKGEGSGRGGEKGVAPYFGKAPLTEPEQVLFHRLKEAMPEQVILAQVAMPALLGIRKNPAWQSQFNEISRKYVDFVICNPDFTVRAVVELDDSTHQRGERIKADAVKDLAFQQISCPMVRFDVREMPSVEQIRLAVSS